MLLCAAAELTELTELAELAEETEDADETDAADDTLLKDDAIDELLLELRELELLEDKLLLRLELED